MTSIDLWEQMMEEYEPVILYMENERIHFDSTSWKLKYKGNEYSYQFDLGSAKNDGPKIGRKVVFTMTHNQYPEASSKTLIFMWNKGRWVLSSWIPTQMKFTNLSKENYVVSEVLQNSLTHIVSELGKKLCQDFEFLKENPDDFSISSMSDDDSEFDDVVSKDSTLRSERIQYCLSDLMKIVECDDIRSNQRLSAYFTQILNRHML